MKKTNHILFTHKDEETFSSEIKNAFPETVFIDDNIWEKEIPLTNPSIVDCKSKFVYIWNREIYPTLPFIQRQDGKFQGPQSGMVIQLIRSKVDEPFLLSGEISVGITVERPESKKMRAFANKIWKILKEVTPKKVTQVDPKTLEIIGSRNDILVGANAYEWCDAKTERFLKFNNNKHIFLKPL